MAVRRVELPGIGPVTLSKRRGNRSLRLSVSSTGEVRVSMPPWLPYRAGEQFAIARASWISAHRGQAPQALQHGQAIGKAHHLYFEPAAQVLKSTSRLVGNEIIIKHPPQHVTHEPGVQSVARSASIRALRREAEQLLPQRLQQLAATGDFSYNSVSVKQLKSRWGSCSVNQDIVLNLFLMQLPWHLIDYVLLHELTHTRVMQHGAPFWQELQRHSPQAKALRKEIREYHPTLG